MINAKEQIDLILREQLKPIMENLNKIPEGKEKEFLKESINELKKTKTLNTEQFIDKFVKITGQTYNAEKLKEIAKKFNQ